jgi:NAD-dependent deacetylase
MSREADTLRGWLAEARRTVVLTGAGVSVASGLRPYRGEGGLWTAQPELALEMRAGVPLARVWALFGPTRADVARAEPNAAHVALAQLEHASLARGAFFTLITQNIDALHARAGSRDVIELHGRLARTRCDGCDTPAFDDAVPHTTPPRCPRCGGEQRPDIVLFDEAIGADAEVGAKRAFRGADLFVALGTSGTVWPAAGFVRWARFEGARTALIDLAPAPGDDWSLVLAGRAEELVPRLVAD